MSKDAVDQSLGTRRDNYIWALCRVLTEMVELADPEALSAEDEQLFMYASRHSAVMDCADEILNSKLPAAKPRATVFVIERRGVYGQGILGVFTDETVALAAAVEAIKAERDSYHDFVVMGVVLGKSTSCDVGLEPLYTIEKTKAGEITVEQRDGPSVPVEPMTAHRAQIIALKAVVATVCESERLAENALAEARDELAEMREHLASDGEPDLSKLSTSDLIAYSKLRQTMARDGGS